MAEYCKKMNVISIHAPREGGDKLSLRFWKRWATFQSTPPARGATMKFSLSKSNSLFQSTPPARGATPTPINANGW